MPTTKQILLGRKAVDSYRTAHTQLHQKPYYRGIHDDHTPLLNTMLADLKEQGFNSLQEFFDANTEYCLSLSGYQETTVFKQRLGLELANTLRGQYGQASIRIEQDCAYLTINQEQLMNTSKREHASMAFALKDCPANARVFIGGLGLGLILLYLAESGKAKEIVVCEENSDLAQHATGKVLSFFQTKYPSIQLELIEGDAFSMVYEQPKFDWVFFDTGETDKEMALASNINSILGNSGVYTRWINYEMEWQ